jgi:hypothetical protein
MDPVLCSLLLRRFLSFGKMLPRKASVLNQSLSSLFLHNLSVPIKRILLDLLVRGYLVYNGTNTEMFLLSNEPQDDVCTRYCFSDKANDRSW